MKSADQSHPNESVTSDDTAEASLANDWLLLPQPRRMEVTGRFSAFRPGNIACSSSDIREGSRWWEIYVDVLKGFPLDRPKARSRTVRPPLVPQTKLAIDPKKIPHSEGYRLTISETGGAQGKAAHIQVVAHDAAGLFYAAQTLKQIARLSKSYGVVPVLQISDWPDFPNRGVMLDISRDKVPTMDTLYDLVDLLAGWKYNQFQLYTEHTFAYEGQHVVWENASPMTPEQIRSLDGYCRDRFIQLVPNQNSFGHMNRWLPHEPYRDLAEVPGGSDLCPIDPGSIDLIAGLYDQLLPNFSSTLFNVGCDETWSLGKGRSKEAAEERGVGRVYLEFLMKIHQQVKKHGKTMQFWGDIILKHPELIPELPKDIIALAWGYEAATPYNEKSKAFADAGVRFYVCPGTSSWNSLVGRTENAVGNLKNAAVNGLAHGAEGYLVTDWGDNGHWQFLPVSYLGYAYGAGVSWCIETNEAMDVPRVLDLYAFRDGTGIMGKLSYDLGNAYRETGVLMANNTLFHHLLLRQIEEPTSEGHLRSMTEENLEQTLAYVDKVMAPLSQARMEGADADLIAREFAMNADMVRFACRLGLARLRAGGVATSQIPKDERQKLAAELEALIPRYRQLWLARNRSGGLRESAGRLENLLRILEGE